MTDDTIIDFADLWEDDAALYADDEETAYRLGTEQFEAHLGRRLLVHDAVEAFLRCEEHPDAGIGFGDERCPDLDRLQRPGDAGAMHYITHPDGVLVEVVGASELTGGGWDDEQGFFYPQWDVEIVTTDGLLCDGKPINPALVDTPWLTLPRHRQALMALTDPDLIPTCCSEHMLTETGSDQVSCADAYFTLVDAGVPVDFYGPGTLPGEHHRPRPAGAFDH